MPPKRVELTGGGAFTEKQARLMQALHEIDPSRQSAKILKANIYKLEHLFTDNGHLKDHYRQQINAISGQELLRKNAAPWEFVQVLGEQIATWKRAASIDSCTKSLSIVHAIGLKEEFGKPTERELKVKQDLGPTYAFPRLEPERDVIPAGQREAPESAPAPAPVLPARDTSVPAKSSLQLFKESFFGADAAAAPAPAPAAAAAAAAAPGLSDQEKVANLQRKLKETQQIAEKLKKDKEEAFAHAAAIAARHEQDIEEQRRQFAEQMQRVREEAEREIQERTRERDEPSRASSGRLATDADLDYDFDERTPYVSRPNSRASRAPPPNSKENSDDSDDSDDSGDEFGIKGMVRIMEKQHGIRQPQPQQQQAGARVAPNPVEAQDEDNDQQRQAPTAAQMLHQDAQNMKHWIPTSAKQIIGHGSINSSLFKHKDIDAKHHLNKIGSLGKNARGAEGQKVNVKQRIDLSKMKIYVKNNLSY